MGLDLPRTEPGEEPAAGVGGVQHGDWRRLDRNGREGSGCLSGTVCLELALIVLFPFGPESDGSSLFATSTWSAGSS